MPDQSTILKYLKVKALADRGDAGERDNARSILSRMEADHPGIRMAAEKYQRSQDPNPAPSPWPQAPTGGFQFKFGGNWEEIFDFARGVVNNAYDFANTVANAYAGRQLVEDYVESSTRSSRAGNVLVTLKMPLSVFQQAQNLNLVQKQAFRQAMHEMLEEELAEMLGEDYNY